MRTASLPMYPLPEIAPVTAAFWGALRRHLDARGLDTSDVEFDDDPGDAGEGLAAHVLFSQLCGYPLVKRLRDHGAVIATPSFGFAGCEGAEHRAFFMVRATDPAERLEDLRGRVFGCNSRLSNTGMNLPRLTLAGIAEGRRFFRTVVMTGGHLSSLDHLRRHTIDACAVDCVTWGLFRKFRPAEAVRYRILARTVSSPCLPYVTSIATDARTVAALRDSLQGVFTDPMTARIRETLGLSGVSVLDAAAYDRLADYESMAADLGYPDLA